MSVAAAGCVVVGAGLAAARTVTTLRENDYAGPITLIGNEGERPYERPGLSKGFLQGRVGADKLYVHDLDWYAEHQVDVRLADPAVAIDRAGRTVGLASGDEIPYEHLVLATGAHPRSLDIPGADLPGVHTLRTLGDSSALREGLERDERWVIIGGGWIGLEVAAAAREADRDVTVLEYEALPLQRVLGDRLAEHFARLHRDHGVDLRTGVSARSIENVDGAWEVGTDDGPIPADLVVMAVGIAPNVELAEGAGLAVDNGIVVDEKLRTSDPAILATGDVANAYNTTLGRRLRVEHWDNARRQGKLAATSILGMPETYDWQPYFYTDQYDLGMEYVGYGSPDDEVVVRGDMDSGEFIAFWLNDEGALTAAMNVNVWKVNPTLRGLIGQVIPTERLTDSEIPLDDL